MLGPDGTMRVAPSTTVNADSLVTQFAPAITTFAAAHPVLMEVVVDDQDHTGEWLCSGVVLAAVTAIARPAASCNSRPLGSMHYLAAASPTFVQRHFIDGVGVEEPSEASYPVFNTKDTLQTTWVRRLCHHHMELPRHLLPSSQAFVTVAVTDMGQGLRLHALVAQHLEDGSLVEPMPNTPSDVPLYWQHARAASSLLDELSRRVLTAARVALLAP